MRALTTCDDMSVIFIFPQVKPLNLFDLMPSRVLPKITPPSVNPRELRRVYVPLRREANELEHPVCLGGARDVIDDVVL
jgi:hypothetical protein